MKPIKFSYAFSLVLFVFSFCPITHAAFVDNGDGTVTDTSTNLMWVKSQNLINEDHPAFDNDGIPQDGLVTWQHAKDFITGMNAGTYTNYGHTNWRMPTIQEMQSLVDYNTFNPSIDPAFPCLPQIYWSDTLNPEWLWTPVVTSATPAGDYDYPLPPEEALCVHFYNGLTIPVQKEADAVIQKSYFSYIRPVRNVEGTMIKLSSFKAVPKNRKVVLQWATEAEVDNAGFNIYKAEVVEKINQQLIPATGSPVSGADYQFVDEEVKNRKTYLYFLEDLDFNGQKTRHGPEIATPRLLSR